MKYIKRIFVMAVLLMAVTFAFPDEAMAANGVKSGTTGTEGDNLTWKLDNNGVLTISGKGAMKDENYYDERPWDEYADDISKIVVGKGVTEVGARAFSNLRNVTSVKIASTVKRIDEGAFTYCQELWCVLWKGDDVEIVGYPFSGCHYELTFYGFKKGNVKKWAENEGISFELVTDQKAEEFYISPDLGQTYATMTWTAPKYTDGYQLYRYNTAQKKYVFVKTLAANVKKYKVSKLSSGTVYRYKIRPFVNMDGEKSYGKESKITFRTRSSQKTIDKVNNKIANGFVGTVRTVSKKHSELSADTLNGYYDRWTQPSDLSQFVDNKGNYCVAYSDKNSKYVYIRAYNKELKQVYSRKIKQLYPLLGGVECDDEGNFFIVWGKTDSKSSPSIFTMAVSKYKKSGEFVKTTKFMASDSWGTKIPFDAGNCDIAIEGNLLVCNYAREMYNGHQSNAVLQLDTKTMKKKDIYSSYNSHSFDQRVLFDKDGIAWFASHGDGYPRAFSVATSSDEKYESYEPFHFYADESAMSNMWVLNVTNARLGGVVETSSGLVLAGASVKSMQESGYNSQVKNMFIMYADPDRKMPDGTSRSGICIGDKVTDKGVKWLTNNTTVGIDTVQIVCTDDDRMVLLWESFKDGNYKNTFYMILASNGKVLQKATKIKNVRLNAFEDPIYKDGFIYWSSCDEYADGSKLKNHRLSLKMLTYEKANLAVEQLKATKTSKKITLKWKKNSKATGYVVYKYNGKSYKKVKAVKGTSCVLSGLKSNTNYKLAVKAYKVIDGKTYYGNMKYLKVKTLKK